MVRDKDRVAFGRGGGLGIDTPLASYRDVAVGVSGTPNFTLLFESQAGQVDGVICEVNPSPTSQIVILQDGLYSVLVSGDIFGVALTGGAVTLTVTTNIPGFAVGAKYNEGAVSPDDQEYAAIWNEIWPMAAGGLFQLQLTESGTATSRAAEITIAKLG